MGWNSWDCYGPTVNESEVKANADYMAENLKQHGWQYILVDIRWFVENDKAGGYNENDPVYTMDENGRLLPAVKKFPSAADGNGFKSLADDVHSKGLKFGIHLMRGIPVEAVKKICQFLEVIKRPRKSTRIRFSVNGCTTCIPLIPPKLELRNVITQFLICMLHGVSIL